MKQAILYLAILTLVIATNFQEPQRDPFRIPGNFTKPSNGSFDRFQGERQTTYNHNNLVLFGFGSGPCWSGSCGGGYGNAPAAPAGYSQVRTGTSCINCGNYVCNQCSDWVSCAANDASWGWGCSSSYPYLGTSASENQWIGKPYTTFLFGYGSSCWSGSGCGETAPVAPSCPANYDEVEYSSTCGKADDNYLMRCFGWDTCAFRRGNSWGCSSSYPHYAFSVRECVASQIIGTKYIQNLGSGQYMAMDQYGNFIGSSTPFQWSVSYAPGSTTTYVIQIANPNTNIYPSSPWYWTAENNGGFRVALTGGPASTSYTQWTITKVADRQFQLQNVWMTSNYPYYHNAYYYDTYDLFFTYDGGSNQGNNAIWNFIPVV